MAQVICETVTGSQAQVDAHNTDDEAHPDIRALIDPSAISAALTAERTATRTLSGARIVKRIGTTASSATPTPNADNHDQYNVTALAANVTFGAPTGTPTDAQPLMIRIKDNGTARTLAWNAAYRAMGVTLPTTTVLGKTLYVGFFWNAADSVWDALATGQQA